MKMTNPKMHWHRCSLAGGILAFLLAVALFAWGVIDTLEVSENSEKHMSKRSLAKPSENIIKIFSISQSSQPEPIDQLPDHQIIFVRSQSPTSGYHSSFSSSSSTSDDGSRFYEWEAWGEKWVLRLWGDSKFLAPSFLVRSEGANDSWVERPNSSSSKCFARGVVEGAKVSDVALNVCNGLSGVIRVGELVYFIEPSGDYRTAPLMRHNDTQGSDSINNKQPSEDDSRTLDTEIPELIRINDSIQNSKSSSNFVESNLSSRPHILSLVSSAYLRSNHEAGMSVSINDTQKRINDSLKNQDLSSDRNERTPGQDSSGYADLHSNVSVSEITGSSYISRPKEFDMLSLFDSAVRQKRFIFSKRHTIEVMVVVDYKMAHYHGKNVDQYVLTLMSVVSLIFRDSSIGNNIDIAVVEVVKPEGKSFAPKKAYENYATGTGKSAEEMLKMFCKWQKQSLKYNAEHPHRYDTALLITRENICRNPYTQRCDTLGLAELGTMCSRYSSCAIVQDNGLSAAFTIAHELGHLLNMPHDNDDKCSPFRGSKVESQKHMNVMSRMLDHNTLPWIWSNCSRYYLSEYFLAGHGDCLEDEPWSNKIAEDDVDLTLAGELFSAAQQCQYVFGKTSSICPYMPKCKRLWCTTTLDEKEGCRTQHMPWADGTPCDKNRWCLRGECVPKSRAELRKIDGNWGAWQQWSSCSRSCGVGVRRSERFCDSPKPLFGGRFCVGERVRYESCKLRDCPKGSLDFRSQQCKQFNGKNFGLPDIPENVKWLPKYTGRDDGCKLFCQAHNSGVSYQLKEKVEDGTPCGPDTYDICVTGKCRVAGCDYVLNSTLKDDWCGVCNGDNSTCQLLTGALEEVQPWGYSSIVVIPEGAARINIVQKAYHDNPADDNYLALVDYETGEYLLNGNWVVSPFEKLVEFGGSLLEYSGSNHAIERINSTKPLQKKLLVQILSVGKLFPPLVSYSFSKSSLDKDPVYAWKLGPWSECSRPCIGHSEQTVFCVREDTKARVADHHCNETLKPLRKRKSCSLDCSVHWTYTKWNACALDESQSCVKKRKVNSCVTSADTEVEVERCSNEPPVTEMDCQKEECPVWKYSEWSPCLCPSKTYVGQQKRLYACYMRERPMNEWECNELIKPIESRSCPCWFAGEWGTECVLEESETTVELTRRMEEVRSRTATPEESQESKNYDGRAYKSPHIQKATVFEAHEDADIQPSCQQGKKRREIICGPPHDPRPDHMCELKSKPSEVSFCQIPCKPTTTTTTTTTTLRSTIPPPPLKTTTQTPIHIPVQSKLSSYTEESLREKNAEKYQTKLIAKGTKGLGPGGYVKGGKKEMERLKDANPTSQSTNEIENSLVEEPDQQHPNDPHSNEIHSHQSIFRTRTEEFDSGEEENNNLVKGRQNLDHHLWQTGRWTECSKECGGGERRRLLFCGGLDPRMCPADLKPKDRESCNTHPCTEWTHGDWGLCHPTKRDPCHGKKHRIVICRNSDGRKSDPLLCLAADRPQSEVSCRIPCDRSKRLNSRYKWRKGPWSPCSESCDGGITTRNVTCIDTMVGQMSVHDEYCLRYDLPRPRSQKHCNKEPCPFRWVAGEWPQCSWKCGPGLQKREISCHRVSPLRWVDPDPVETGCQKRKMPVAERPCNLGTCSKGYFWVTRPWKPCQAPCGSKGRQRRSVICVDFKGVRAQRTHCSRTHRPRRKQKCRAPTCGSKTCNEARAALGVTIDGEYSLLVGGINMSIFCYGMNTTEPKEYLTLPAGEEGNYAEIYDKRLLRPDTCPFNGERSDRCNCVSDESGRAGFTTFSKVRLNTTSLAVNTFDFTFARVIKGRLIAYGEAGDCYSTTQCPQGSFSINLAGTNLRVSERTTWKGHGNKAAHWINRLDESQRIFGRCGGYCGTCTPDPVLGLKFDVRITEEMMKRKQ